MKPRKIIFAFATLTVALVGCNNFNHIITVQSTSLSTDNYPAEVGTKPVPVVEKSSHANEASIVACPAYKLPTLPRTPELPYKALRQIDPNDHQAIDSLHLKHIEELRLHVVKVKTLLQQSHTAYLVNCKRLMQNSK